jgi:hypothetical protein
MRLPIYKQWVKRFSIKISSVSLLHSFHYARRDFRQSIALAPVARLKTGRPAADLAGDFLGAQKLSALRSYRN